MGKGEMNITEIAISIAWNCCGERYNRLLNLQRTTHLIDSKICMRRLNQPGQKFSRSRQGHA
jgi:hypothetical protein